MELLFYICVVSIIVLSMIVLFKMKIKRRKDSEVKCLICGAPLISSNYSICYKCRNKSSQAS